MVIDFFTDREPHVNPASELFELNEQGAVKLCLSAVSINNIYYIVRRFLGHKKTIEVIELLTDMLEIVGTTKKEIIQALKNNFSDFEDSVQYSSALSIKNLDAIITRNTKDYRNASLVVMTPLSFLKMKEKKMDNKSYMLRKIKMARDILDDGFINKEGKRTKVSNWIAIIVLWVGIGYCGTKGLLGEIKVIVAASLLFVSTALMCFNYKLGVKVVLFTVLIGVANLITFFPFKYFMSFGINSIQMGFEFILFAIGVIHYLTNKGELSAFFKEVFKAEVSEKESKKRDL